MNNQLDPQAIELRTRARLAWNNWEDNELSRASLFEQEVKAIAANDAWDRVVAAIIDELKRQGKVP